MQDSLASYDSLRPGDEQVATVLPAERAFSPAKPTFHVPAGWLVLANLSDGCALLHESNSTVDGNNVVDLLLARANPIQIEITEQEIASADGYPCSVQIRLWVRLAQDAGDLKSFRSTVLGGKESASAETVRRYLNWHCRRIMTQFAQQYPAADLADGKGDDTATILLCDRLQPALFAGGLTLYEQPQIQFECDSLRQIRGEHAQTVARRQLQAALAEAHRRQLSEIEFSLRHLQAQCEKSAGATLGDLIHNVPQPHRRKIYEALWSLLPAQQRTAWIVAVAGTSVLCFDPDLPDSPARQVALDGPVGPLRSVRLHRQTDGEEILLIGAARGVYRVGADDLKVRSVHSFTTAEPHELRGGVNAAALWKNTLFATHSEIGLIAWNITQRSSPCKLLTDLMHGAHAVRRVQLFDQWLALSVDDRVIVCPAENATSAYARTYHGCRARITSLHVAHDEIVTGDEIGEIHQWPMSRPENVRRLRNGEGLPIESIVQFRLGGVPCVVFAERSTPSVQLLPCPDPSQVIRYASGQHAIRRCAAAGDLLVAVGENRDRLLIWRPAESMDSCADINVTAQCGHRIQDICLITETK